MTDYEDVEVEVALTPGAPAPASVFLGNCVYADFINGEYFKIYVSDGQFSGRPILMSFEDIGQLHSYAALCKQSLEGKTDDNRTII